MSWFTRTRAAYIAVALVLAVVGWRSASVGGPSAAAPAVEVRSYAATPETPAAAAPVVVHVVGRVRRPGVYRLATGNRVGDALRRAGGASRGADLTSVNLAAPLVDGSQIVVPARGAPGRAAGAPTAAAAAGDGPVSLATATPAQLEALDGIGPTLAARIVEWRDAHGGFRTVDDLGQVPGIGEGRLAALRERVVP